MKFIGGVIILSGMIVFSSGCKKVSENTVSNSTTSAIRFYGNEYGNLLSCFGQTRDGGYYFGGSTNSSPANAGQGFIQKTDIHGNVLWYNNYGGPAQDVFQSVKATSDGGFICAGSTVSYGLGAKKYYPSCYLVKTDSRGNQTWFNTFGYIYWSEFFDVAETPDHGFVAVGGIQINSDNSELYILKTDINGKMLWYRELFNGYFISQGCTVTVNPNGDIAVGGYVVKSTYAVDQGTNYPVFILLSPSGHSLNAISGSGNPYPEYKNWGSIGSNNGNIRNEKIVAVPDGNIYAVNLGSPVNSVMLFKVDTIGNVVWNHQFFGLKSASMNDMTVNATGGYLISGVTNDTSGKNYCWILNTDPAGNKLWETHIPVKGYSAFAAGLCPTGKNYAMGINLSSMLLNLANNFGFLTTDQNGNILEIK